MLTILSYLVKYKKVIGLLVLGLLVSAITIYILHLKSTISDLKEEVTSLNTVIAANNTTIATLTKSNQDKETNLSSMSNLLSSCTNSKQKLTDDLNKMDTIISCTTPIQEQSTDKSTTTTNVSKVTKEKKYEVLSTSQSISAIDFLNDQFAAIK